MRWGRDRYQWYAGTAEALIVYANSYAAASQPGDPSRIVDDAAALPRPFRQRQHVAQGRNDERLRL